MGLTSTAWQQVKGSSNTWTLDITLAKQLKRYEIAEYPRFEKAIAQLPQAASIHMAWNHSNGVWEWEMSTWNWPWEDENEGPVEGSGYGTGTNHSDSGNASNRPCQHDWVNVSFAHIHMACRHCGLDKPD